MRASFSNSMYARGSIDDMHSGGLAERFGDIAIL